MAPRKISASVVLFHSCIHRLNDTLIALAVAAKHSQYDLTLSVIDQSMDEDYSRRVEAVCASALQGSNVTVAYQQTSSNRGYGAGHNLTLANNLGAIHLILNPDIELDPRAITKTIDVFATRPEIALISPKGMLPDGTDDYLAKRHPTLLALLLRGFAPRAVQRIFSKQLDHYQYRDLEAHEKIAPIELASGCFMAIRAEVWLEVGGFDERFFLYFEDYDLSKRVARHGLVVRCSDVMAVHHGGNASRKGLKHIALFTQGLIQFNRRWGWKFF